MNSQKFNYSLPYIARARIRVFFPLVIIFIGTVIGLLFFQRLTIGINIPTFYILFALMFLGLFKLWTPSCEIVVERDKITYREPSLKQEILTSNIKRMEATLNLDSSPRKKRGIYLNLYDDKKFSEKPFAINLALFSKKDLRVLINVVVEESPSVEMDETTYQMKEGDFHAIYLRLGTYWLEEIWRKICKRG